MPRFDRRYAAGLQVAIWLSLALVFVADLATPLGISVWVLYLVPLIVCLFGWRPAMPVIVSVLTTVLIVLGFFLKPPGIAPSIAILDRVFGVTVVWTVGITGHQLLKNKLIVSEQNWLRDGQNRLGAHMQGEQVLHALGDKVIRFLSEYLNAQVGAIYVRSEEGVFERFASYALDLALAPGNERILPGAGLSGQVIKDRRAFVLKELPADYMRISSTLGNSKPAALIVVPALAEGEVEAVIELGFITETDALDVNFLELVGESIGMAVRASKYRTRLEELLEETQRQADELQAQSEELRVSNEELESQSRALRESQKLQDSQQSELEATNTQLEETNAQLEEQKRVLEAQKLELSGADAALRERAEELARASQYKSEFLANMSHELRTPLNSSLILSKLLADNKSGNLTDEQVKFANTIYSAGNDLLNLVNDILDLSKIEAGGVQVQPDTVSIARLTDSLVQTFQPVAAERKLSFTVETDSNTPAFLITDPQRLRQVLNNLLSNAFKFSEKGGVSVRVSTAPNDAVAFAVKDTGIGIPQEQQQVIFDAFRQADGSTQRKYGGTGLGLSISQDLATLLGGKILVESAVGEGSTFSLIVPRESPAQPADRKMAARAATAVVNRHEPLRREPPVAPSPKPAPAVYVEDDRSKLHTGQGTRTLLVIEDDERFARILYDLAHEVGFQCVIAGTAADGLALVREIQPSAVILDMRLPDQSGLYVLDQLKRTPATRHIPVHVVSVADNTCTARELGAVGYAIKPVKREELISALRKLESKLDQTVRRILIVEDDDRQRESIQRLLESPGVQLTAVASAAETLEQLRAATFDCVVMDLGLNDMTGYDLLDRMANEEAYSFPPVIIYTGRVLEPLDEQRLRRYSQSIIIKGARSPERLLDEVTLFLHQVESRLPADQQRMLRLVRDRDSVLEGRRILVVEDDVRSIFAITSILEPKGAKIEIARNGKEAIEIVERGLKQKPIPSAGLASESGPIDLVLMDIMMPEMDGLTATRQIRSRGEFARLPIIALTAKAMPDDREQCIAAGANDYISKPLDVDKLVSLTRVWMPKS
ncbi:MAG TPA: response regulator [Terriglobia bacterium]|jgi:signal transduction histidine kinase/CheY-like chemotaxis protein